MVKIHKQALAEQDLLDIWLYTYNNWDAVQADKYLDRLDNAFSLIAENPAIGNECNYIRQGYRKYQIERHVIFYTADNSKASIIRVIGAAMDYQRHF